MVSLLLPEPGSYKVRVRAQRLLDVSNRWPMARFSGFRSGKPRPGSAAPRGQINRHGQSPRGYAQLGSGDNWDWFGVRENAFGYLIVELDAVRALDRPNNGWRFVFGITPGY